MQVVKKADALKAIRAEINWCRENEVGPTAADRIKRKSFISGLRQAKRILREMPAMKEGEK